MNLGAAQHKESLRELQAGATLNRAVTRAVNNNTSTILKG
jgi:hypothetical protein